MKDYKNIGDSRITKMHKRRNKKHSTPTFTMADLIAIGLCVFTTLYIAVRAY